MNQTIKNRQNKRCDDIPDKYCIPTHSCGQTVYLVLEFNDGIMELDEQFTLKIVGEVICNHFFSGTLLDF